MHTLLKTITVILVSIFFASCGKGKLQGVWIVDRVQRETHEVKPQARWIRFKTENMRQESGNGWQKHSVGTWTYKKRRVTIVNTNGYLNEFPTFKVKFEKDGMEWSVEENGKMTRVYLSKLDYEPTTNRDKMLGVWDLKTVLVDGEDRTLEYDPRSKRYIHLNWDNTFEADFTKEGRLTGMYRMGGTRNEMELFVNNESCDRETWKYEIKDDRLVLTSVNTAQEVIMEYLRINFIPREATTKE